ncbi:MAG TPA: carboxymuconolactone decarboxylase family protein [Gordonia sp. (in: high G+C Gram-positive bacteria)]|uniref:carboxymuconolactone decarboxylase family protein n=1 Tax=unclassified Gordonia (in: high G+C Gram-positive bacteria) TaxID=2657482 RepID=UPI000FB26A04|nr:MULTISPECIES: carboxymuconolactone decarboxylase family protein [unclassified Gordonia (in: high G+C Gram-positive bacteria)]RUP41265.1 MAG: carboxymuconolactone decarboxylase family protein [Gordonia sp. (in: high G+C Gram-positive bacteria)]HNP55529.1 carboxymuconolactone decarboxylase family protein [Gordonia sp. (in: high G+C Gram-positive bacteria)]HRC50998.1 carboxymuconolactone decarboxylase family protein [Gordonia sp. (in: high G+C Gram-positive bacteria)]
MRALHRLWSYLKVFAKSKRNRMDLYAWLVRRPQVLIATGGYEVSLLFSNRLDPHYKELALLKSAGMVSCEFCLDIGSALARTAGISEQALRDLPVYAESDVYTDLEKLVLSFAEAMTATPAVGDDLTRIREGLLDHFTKGQVAELAAEIAWENQRARLNQALGVRPTGMSDGAACALPERRVS